MYAPSQSICRVCPFREQSIFADLSTQQLDEFCRLKTVSRYRKNQRIFYEGEPALGLSILCSGKARVSRSSGNDRSQILDIAAPCGLLGEKDLFSSDRHTVTAVAIEECTVCFVQRDHFLDFVEGNAVVANRLLESLSAKLDQAERRAINAASLSAKTRLAGLLLDLAERHGRAVHDGRMIDVTLTRENIAEMIGSTAETVIRTLSGLRKDGIIRNAGKHVTVLRVDKLRELAQ